MRTSRRRRTRRRRKKPEEDENEEKQEEWKEEKIAEMCETERGLKIMSNKWVFLEDSDGLKT